MNIEMGGGGTVHAQVGQGDPEVILCLMMIKQK